ncbi:DUF523 domain-containing protein [Treponema sp. OMZ 857]|uniref:DUF523 domain-containing protein n=1 Tax=Treponema sp. OMZ 857 TaxID=1643513 RepID=UPI0020A59DB3|nr:DUF523 domain-containing protein [Treponema sp. OMZ 857]UTC43855.1 DUF523 domain-containing protein [Treponema sp. OMZ 857]
MIIVSACLAGFPCRYDGKKAINPAVQQLVKEGKAIPVCPEQLGGLPTPRSAAEMKAGKVINTDGDDVTEAFEKGAAVVLEIAQQYGCKDALLKARSPSCGKGLVYDGTFSGILTAGNGKTADLLMRNGITVMTEEEWSDIDLPLGFLKH